MEFNTFLTCRNSLLIGRETILRYSPAETTVKRRSKRPASSVRRQELQIVSNKLRLEAVLQTAKGGKPKAVLASAVDTVFAAFVAVEYVKDEKRTLAHFELRTFEQDLLSNDVKFDDTETVITVVAIDPPVLLDQLHRDKGRREGERERREAHSVAAVINAGRQRRRKTESPKWKWSELVTIKGFTMIFLAFMTFTKLDHRIDHLRLMVATRIAFNPQSTSVYPDFVEGIYYVVNISALVAYGYVFLHVAIMHNTGPFYRAASVEVCRFIYQYLDQIYMAVFVAQEDVVMLSRGYFMLLLFSWCLEYGFVRLLLWNPNRRFRLKHVARHFITSIAVNIVLVGIYFALNASKNTSLRNPTRVHDLTKPVGEQLGELAQERAQLSALHDWLVENDPSKNKYL
ncbi:hypothetical protein AAVH_25884 [Aphelenchoides avenae]|nr:hypothetical protein AAVH_25884 [Aphelenchus avenae]